jgi:hypothetical protein
MNVRFSPDNMYVVSALGRTTWAVLVIRLGRILHRLVSAEWS